MRVLVLFDLPVETKKNRRDYTRFRKYLIRSGYAMLQESVYCKLVPNREMCRMEEERLESNKPPVGLVQVLHITEKQFTGMKCIVGNVKSDTLQTSERLVII